MRQTARLLKTNRKRAVAFPQIPTLIVLIEHEKSALLGATGDP